MGGKYERRPILTTDLGMQCLRNAWRETNSTMPFEVDVWQRRYWEHRIPDVDDFRRHVEYTHFNPVKHGHVTNLADWPWSTFHDHVQQGWVEPDWGIIEPDDIVNLEAGE